MLGIINEHGGWGRPADARAAERGSAAKIVPSVLWHSVQWESSQPQALLAGWPACEHPPPFVKISFTCLHSQICVPGKAWAYPCGVNSSCTLLPEKNLLLRLGGSVDDEMSAKTFLEEKRR